MGDSDVTYLLYPPGGVTSASMGQTHSGGEYRNIWGMVRGYPSCIYDGVPDALLNALERNHLIAANEYFIDFIAEAEALEQARRDIVAADLILADPESTQQQKDDAQASKDAALAVITGARQEALDLETLRGPEPERFNTPGDPNSGETAEWTTWDDLLGLNDDMTFAQMAFKQYIKLAFRYGRISWTTAWRDEVIAMGNNVAQ